MVTEVTSILEITSGAPTKYLNENSTGVNAQLFGL